MSVSRRSAVGLGVLFIRRSRQEHAVQKFSKQVESLEQSGARLLDRELLFERLVETVHDAVMVHRDTVLFAHHGNVRHRHLGDQAAQAACLRLVVNCVAAWNANAPTWAADPASHWGLRSR